MIRPTRRRNMDVKIDDMINILVPVVISTIIDIIINRNSRKDSKIQREKDQMEQAEKDYIAIINEYAYYQNMKGNDVLKVLDEQIVYSQKLKMCVSNFSDSKVALLIIYNIDQFFDAHKFLLKNIDFSNRNKYAVSVYRKTVTWHGRKKALDNVKKEEEEETEKFAGK